MTVPILFLVFNRPDTAQQVFDEIKKQRPSKLYIAADGPRAGKPNEAERCAATRKIIDQIDWPCQVKTLFREENLGCKLAVSSAITWFFEQEPEGIILEDDCLPHPTFFNYCATLLEQYRLQDNVMLISGANFQNGIQRGNGSYYFGRNPHIWGWASWRRAWDKYDLTMQTYPLFKSERQIEQLFTHPLVREFWIKTFDEVFAGKVDTWDYQWIYTIFAHGGLCINPNVNLISNIGFGEQATHTTNKDDRFSKLSTTAVSNLIHPTFMIPNQQADEYFYRQLYSKTTLVLSWLKHSFKFPEL